MPEYFTFNSDSDHPHRLFGIPFTEMVKIEAKEKEFIMIDNINKKKLITFDHDFYIGAYPVTQALYEKVMGENPSSYKGPQRPVEQVSWNDIMKDDGFLSKLNKKFSNQFQGSFTLPSEAQWLYAAAASASPQDRMAYAGGNDLHDVGWFQNNNGFITMPVGLKQPNASGLFDISGNVWEWCLDDWGELDALNSSGRAAANQQDKLKVDRGGSFGYRRGDARLPYRNGYRPGDRARYHGFRLCFLSSS